MCDCATPCSSNIHKRVDLKCSMSQSAYDMRLYASVCVFMCLCAHTFRYTHKQIYNAGN